MKYAAIDTETTGLGERCALIELAIVLEDTEARPLPPVEELPSWTSLVNPGSAGCWWEPVAMDMHRKSGLLTEWLAELAAQPGAPSPIVAATEARAWLANLGHGRDRSLTPAGKNFAGFDKRFLPKELADVFHHRVIDPGSVFVDFTKDKLPGLNDLIDYAAKPGVAHRALEDARDVVRVLRRRYA